MSGYLNEPNSPIRPIRFNTLGPVNRAWERVFIVGITPESENAARHCRHIFGPVPSRRMGLSLGLDLAPHKTCTLDCLYCEVGRTTALQIERFPGYNTDDLLDELAEVLPELEDRLDFVTLAGSGEPTLNRDLGFIIGRVKDMTDIPVAVLTNGTLLWVPEVRKELRRADLVIPSLDTAVEKTFRRLNRPHPELNIDRIIEGLLLFAEDFPGSIWLEILLVAGYNDAREELEALRTVADKVNPDLIQVNTVYRPPAYGAAKPLTPEDLDRASEMLGPRAKAVGAFTRAKASIEDRNLDAEIMAMLRRRPCTASDLADALGLEPKSINTLLDRLEEGGMIHSEKHVGANFYRCT